MQLNHKTLGAGDPLVVLHGLFGTLDNWQTIAKSLAESRMPVLVDQRNHGKSPHLESHSYPAMAEDLNSFLEEQWMHEVDLLGHSMGGKTAMQFALNFADRVRKLIVVDMTPRAYSGGHEAILKAMATLPLGNGEGKTILTRQEIDAHLAKQIPDQGVRLFLMKNLRRQRDGGYEWKINLPVLIKDYTKVLAPITGEPWTGEALFVRGANSNYVRDEDLPGIRALFPNAQLATIADAGHWVHADAPTELQAIVEEFLGRT